MQTAPRLPSELQTSPQAMRFKVVDLEAGSRYAPEVHDCGQFAYAFSGVLEVDVPGNESSAGPCDATQHSWQCLAPPQYGIWIPPHTRHTAGNRHKTRYCSLYLAAALCEGMPRQVSALALAPLTKALLDSLSQRQLEEPGTAAERRLFEVLVDQLKASPGHASYLPSSNDPQLGQVLQALQQQPEDMQPLAHWAAQVHCTEKTLSRRCQRDLGMPLSEWRQRLKVLQAIRLLESGLAVKEVALQLGYSHSSAFIAMFQRQMQQTPEAYRERRRG